MCDRRCLVNARRRELTSKVHQRSLVSKGNVPRAQSARTPIPVNGADITSREGSYGWERCLGVSKV